MNVGLFTVYCIDTSAIIDFSGQRFPKDIFPDLWSDFTTAVEGGSIVSVRESYREIRNGADADLINWARDHIGSFLNPDEAIKNECKRIVNKYPDCLDLLKTKPYNADPWIIATASVNDLIAVSSENPRSPKKIPTICEAEGVQHLDTMGFLRHIGWTFSVDGVAE